MFFKVTEVFDYTNDHFVYHIYREELLLHKSIRHKDLENFVMDRTCLYDTDLIQYTWSSHVMTGNEARDLIRKMFEPPVTTTVWA